MKYFIFLIAVLIALSACRGKVACKNGGIGYVLLKPQDTNFIIRDTEAVVSQYIQGTSFGSPMTTYHCYMYREPGPTKICVVHSVLDVTAYDWKITAYPSGNEYRIKDGHFESKKETILYDGYECWNSIILNCNGKTVTIPDLNGYCYIYLDY